MIVEKEGFGIEEVCASAVVLVVYKGSSIDFVLAEDPCGVCGETASRTSTVCWNQQITASLHLAIVYLAKSCEQHLPHEDRK